MRGMAIRGISFWLPEKTLTNEELIKDFGTWTSQKIYKKTGVLVRRIAESDKPMSYFLAKVGNLFFEEHPDITRDSIDMLVICCEERDYILPATACIVHDLLGLRSTCGAMDYDLGCSGYVYGLSIAKGYIASGIADRVLFITGDLVSRRINKHDKSLRTIFGDGYAATLLELSDTDKVRGFDLGTDGSGAHDIIIEAGCTAMPYSEETAIEITNRFGNSHSKEQLFMDGRKVLEFSRTIVPGSVDRTLERAGLSKKDIDLVVFHQASLILLETVRELLGVPEEKFVIDLEDKGNTASSTIPITLADCVANGRLKKGMKVLISGFGVGLSWATAVLEWDY